MGSLVEVTIIRVSDDLKLDGHAWTRDDGKLEAFWYENGSRLNFLFEADGTQIGLFHGCKKYKLERKS